MSLASSRTCSAQPYQFSLRATLGIMTAVQVCVALLTWDRDVGSLLSILLVGSCCLVAAVKAGRLRLAYALAAWVTGAAFYLVLSLPISPASYEFLQACKYWPEFTCVVAMCTATAAASMLLERPITKAGGRHPVLVGLALTYVTVLAYPAAWIGVAVLFRPTLGPPVSWPSVTTGGSPTFAGHCIEAVYAIPFSVIITTLSLHVAAGVGIAGAYLLRWIAVAGADVPQAERSTLQAVEELQGEGRDPIRCYHVAQRIGCDAATVFERLQHLWEFHRLTWSPLHGYRRTR